MAVLKGVAGFAIGLFVAGALLIAARYAAFGSSGVAVSPSGSSVIAQVIVAVGWGLGSSAGSWLAIRVGGWRAGLFVAAWLFSMTWLSPDLRPFEVGMRAVCAIAVAVGGLAVVLRDRIATIRDAEAAKTA